LVIQWRNQGGKTVFNITDVEKKDPDLVLVHRFKGGDEGAFVELFRRYSGQMINFAYRFTGSREVAEELAQEIFMKVHAQAARFEPRAKFSTWLFRVAANHCLNEVRRDKYKHARVELDDGVGDPASGPDQAASGCETGRAILEALGTLPENQRIAMIMLCFHGSNYEEIRAALGCSEQALKSLVHRARETLKHRLKDYTG
jgi:RNA polymerase sigma-70 factor (ECF subfamily)